MNTWYLLPGMGASCAMYEALGQKLDFPVTLLDWPPYRGEKTYADMARRIVAENALDHGDVIGGSSLGGMVALEIGRIVRPRAIVLLGSALSSGEVQGLLTMLSPLAAVTPISLVQVLAGKQKSLFSTMFADADPEFVRAMCAYLRLWPGCSGEPGSIRRLHGKRDHVIPCPSSGAVTLEGAGHLLVMTHPDETAAFLREVKSKLDKIP
jgi:pimeloyl-ACP methyl ester carboxylesterase